MTKPKDFLIVTAAADRGLVDIHDRRPLVLSPEAAQEWMRQEIGGKEASEIATNGCVPANQFTGTRYRARWVISKNQGSGVNSTGLISKETIDQ
ncbi:SOS response-associated peptidase family protein [Escherichia coli]|nr:SOS response-associated peptidase family protein [Escherichia coli]